MDEALVSLPGPGVTATEEDPLEPRVTLLSPEARLPGSALELAGVGWVVPAPVALRTALPAPEGPTGPGRGGRRAAPGGGRPAGGTERRADLPRSPPARGGGGPGREAPGWANSGGPRPARGGPGWCDPAAAAGGGGPEGEGGPRARPVPAGGGCPGGRGGPAGGGGPRPDMVDSSAYSGCGGDVVHWGHLALDTSGRRMRGNILKKCITSTVEATATAAAAAAAKTPSSVGCLTNVEQNMAIWERTEAETPTRKEGHDQTQS